MWIAPWLSLSLYAQQPLDPAVPAELPSNTPSELVPLGPTSLTEGWLWVDAGPRTVIDLVDATIHPQDERVWAVVAGEGSVWVTTQGGSRWFEVLGPIGGRSSTDEEALTEIEARLGELASSVDAPDESALEDGDLDEDELADELERAAADAAAEAQQVIDEVQAELEAQPWFLPQGEAGARPLRPRIQFSPSGLLVVARVDGLYLSEDLGSSWHHLLEEPVSCFLEFPGGGFIAGTPTGARWSATLLDWQPLAALDGVSVQDLTAAEGLGALASTDQGLWWSGDGVSWTRTAAWLDEVSTARFLPEPAQQPGPGPLVLGARDSVWKAMRPMQEPARPTAGELVPGALAFAQLQDGLLLAASPSGPFESTDQGGRWVSLAQGLEMPAIADIEARSGAQGPIVLITTRDGLKRRARATVRPDATDLPPWVPLGALVEASTQRRELTARGGKRLARALLPELTFEYTRNQVVGDDWDVDTWTIRGVDTWWSGRVQLTWRPGTVTSDTYDAEVIDDLQLLVFDDEIVLDDGSLTALLGSKVNRGSIAYRSELSETISRLYLTRQRLALEQRWLTDEPLYEQTLRALQLAEVEARLDALTDGAVSRWDAGGSP